MKIKNLIAVVLVVSMTGCAGIMRQHKADKAFANEIKGIIVDALKNNTGCSALCVKLKQAVAAKMAAEVERK